MYSEAIHCVYNNGSESLLHDLSSFSFRITLAQTHAMFLSPLPILLVYTLCIILWASVLHFFTCISCVGHILRNGRDVSNSILLHFYRYIGLANSSRTALFKQGLMWKYRAGHVSGKPRWGRTCLGTIHFYSICCSVLHNVKLLLYSCQISFVITNFVFWSSSIRLQ